VTINSFLSYFIFTKWTRLHNFTASRCINNCLHKLHIFPATEAQIPLVLSRNDTTRYLAHALWHRKKSCKCCVALVGQHGANTLVTRQARLERHVFRGVATAWTGVNMITSLVPDIDANPEHKKTKLVHASTTASSSSAMMEQARSDTHDQHDTLVATRVTSRHHTHVT